MYMRVYVVEGGNAHRATVGSYGRFVFYERGTPVECRVWGVGDEGCEFRV